MVKSKIRKRPSKNVDKTICNHNQKGGLLLRKNRRKKLNDIKNFTITAEGIRWCGGLKTQFKKLFGKGSCGLIRYSNMIKPPTTNDDNTEILINVIRDPAHYKIYKLDNQWDPATNLPRPPRNSDVYKFFIDIRRGYTNYQAEIIEEQIEEAERKLDELIAATKKRLGMTGGKRKHSIRKRKKNKNRKQIRSQKNDKSFTPLEI